MVAKKKTVGLLGSRVRTRTTIGEVILRAGVFAELGIADNSQNCQLSMIRTAGPA